MKLLESVRSDPKKQRNWLLIGAVVIFAAGSTMLDGIWQEGPELPRVCSSGR
jgi:hypothetical protein